MTRPELIALDLDGTLLGSDKRISPRNEQAIRTLTGQGALVVLCTGRPPRLTHEYAATLDLELALVYNGASTYYPLEQRSDHHGLLAGAVALDAIRRLRQTFPGILLGLETPHGWYLDPALFERRRARPAAAEAPLPDGVGPVEGFVRESIIKLFARHPERSAGELAGALRGLPVYATWSGRELLEVLAPEANKCAALGRLAGLLGIPREAVAAFGDQHNDREMLAWAGCGVAMANGSPEARAAADEITASNDEDGVAAVLERWLARGPDRAR